MNGRACLQTLRRGACEAVASPDVFEIGDRNQTADDATAEVIEHHLDVGPIGHEAFVGVFSIGSPHDSIGGKQFGFAALAPHSVAGWNGLSRSVTAFGTETHADGRCIAPRARPRKREAKSASPVPIMRNGGNFRRRRRDDVAAPVGKS